MSRLKIDLTDIVAIHEDVAAHGWTRLDEADPQHARVTGVLPRTHGIYEKDNELGAILAFDGEDPAFCTLDIQDF